LALWQSTPIDIPVIKRKIRQIIYGRFSLITDTPQQQHEMIFDGQTAAGEDEWYCPTCGRRLLIQWPPAYQRTMINPGDEYAIHTVSKGGLKMTSSQAKQSSSLDLAEMNSLNLWNDLLDQIGFDQWWQRDL
jgi:hypothetical protein